MFVYDKYTCYKSAEVAISNDCPEQLAMTNPNVTYPFSFFASLPLGPDYI